MFAPASVSEHAMPSALLSLFVKTRISFTLIATAVRPSSVLALMAVTMAALAMVGVTPAKQFTRMRPAVIAPGSAAVSIS